MGCPACGRWECHGCREAEEPLEEGVDYTLCPKCGGLVESDGLPCLAHDACGYCGHPSRDGDGKGNMVCGICGDVKPTIRLTDQPRLPSPHYPCAAWHRAPGWSNVVIEKA